MKKIVFVVATLAGVTFGVAGFACFAVSSQVFETSNGFYVTIASRTIELPDNGLLGDFGTYVAEWGMLGLCCLAVAAMLVITPRVHDRLLREVAIVALVLALAAVAMFAQIILL